MSELQWTGTCRSRWANPVATTLLALAVVVALTVAMWTAALLVVGSAVIMIFRRITVTIDGRELVVRFSAPWSWPMRVNRNEIESATAESINPLKWGGYGYRGSMRLFKRAALLLRKGEALRLTLENGRTLLITVDDAEGAVAALDG